MNSASAFSNPGPSPAPNSRTNLNPQGDWAARLGQFYGLATLLATLAALPMLDTLTAVLLLLTTFLFAVVTHYSRRYLGGNPGQARFTVWLCLTGSSVFGIILAQNLLVLAAAWCTTSLALHQLLQFADHRPGAILAARKKFLISRLGDLALFTALWLTYQQFRTLELPAILAAGRTEGLPESAALLFVVAALLKSAQFPFHSWLPETMETPTPVSALMHAGIINAGGILVLRLSPVLAQSESALALLLLAGGVTALYGSLVMTTQCSIKRCLAYSTIAQMGFMMLECGLGAFSLALLHLVAHSLYKAYAFLASGSVVPEGPGAVQAAQLARTARPSAWALLFSIAAAAGIVLPLALWVGHAPQHHPAATAIFTLAVAQLIAHFAQRRPTRRLVPVALLLGAFATVAYLLLDRAASQVVTPLAQEPAFALALLPALLLPTLLQHLLPHFGHRQWAQRLFVHARNGFYAGTIASRFTLALWPTPQNLGLGKNGLGKMGQPALAGHSANNATKEIV